MSKTTTYFLVTVDTSLEPGFNVQTSDYGFTTKKAAKKALKDIKQKPDFSWSTDHLLPWKIVKVKV